MKNSEFIQQAIQFFEQCEKDYRTAYDAVNREDKLTQDLLHAFELDELKAPERNKIGKEISINRKNRRYYKDVVESTEPVLNYIAQNKKAVDCLKNLLGELRKVEQYHSKRKYKPRVRV